MSTDRRNPARRQKFPARRRMCQYCLDEVSDVDYKDGDRLRRFINERGKIRPRRQTGVCAKHQRRLAVAIKRARHMALLPFVAEMRRH